VRAMAVWALSRLMPGKSFADLAAGRGHDDDPLVEAEWQMAGA
jgi:epoxyqueuosine reductase